MAGSQTVLVTKRKPGVARKNGYARFRRRRIKLARESSIPSCPLFQIGYPIPQRFQIFNVERHSSSILIEINGTPQPSLCLLSAAGGARVAGKVHQNYNIPRMNRVRLEQDWIASAISIVSDRLTE
jgi:hypothetical protein